MKKVDDFFHTPSASSRRQSVAAVLPSSGTQNPFQNAAKTKKIAQKPDFRPEFCRGLSKTSGFHSPLFFRSRQPGQPPQQLQEMINARMMSQTQLLSSRLQRQLFIFGILPLEWSEAFALRLLSEYVAGREMFRKTVDFCRLTGSGRKDPEKNAARLDFSAWFCYNVGR